MTDDMIETIAIGAAVLALALAARILLRAWLESRAKRRRLATAYYEANRTRVTQVGPNRWVEQRPAAPLDREADGGGGCSND